MNKTNENSINPSTKYGYKIPKLPNVTKAGMIAELYSSIAILNYNIGLYVYKSIVELNKIISPRPDMHAEACSLSTI